MKRVKAPFGKNMSIGYVIGLEDIQQDDISVQKDLFASDILPNLYDADIKKTFKLKRITEIIDEDVIITDEILHLSKYLSENYLCSLGEAISCAIPTGMQKGKRAKKSKEKSAEHISQECPIYKIPPSLTDSQTLAFNSISKSISENRHQKFLLYGVTASGKTEVYLNIIEFVLSLNKSSIMLIPEIALSAQFSDIVLQRFGNRVGLWHSNISAIEKYRVFKAALNGEIKIMLGARSAIFAPFKDIGAIIIDEEHEHTYKQEQKPSYDAREIAFWRGAYHNAAVILGSATPSLESFTDALEKKITLIEMPHRIDNRQMPEIKILSLKDKPRFGGLLLSETVSALSRTLKNKEQAIVLINRRGFSTSVMCKKCQQVYQCPNCSVSMVHHGNPDILKCHYCGAAQNFPITCPNCKSREFLVFGVGAQKVEDELKKLFPKSKILRLDGDTASQKGMYEKAYKGIMNEEYDVLLGTQMIAKGFDFAKISLVCVIDADTSLYLPDFKSVEKTFQLITQVSGRCGRGDTAGNVIIQTSHPNHYAIEYAQKYDFYSFYKKEIEHRKALFYPPFCDIAKITVRNKDEDKTLDEIEHLFSFCSAFSQQNSLSVQLLGPVQSYVKKMNNIYRMHIIMKGKKSEILKIGANISLYSKLFSNSQIIIEIMPSDLI
jgi:primosomal protein N' (replication factor Y)